jgi:CHASE3 domain sensor protein
MKFSIGTKLWCSFLSILVVLIVLGVSSYLNTMKFTENRRWVAHTHDVLIQLTSLLISVQDAETGQRGYVITGEEHYLEPYQAASRRLDAQMRKIKEMTATTRPSSRE